MSLTISGVSGGVIGASGAGLGTALGEAVVVTPAVVGAYLGVEAGIFGFRQLQGWGFGKGQTALAGLARALELEAENWLREAKQEEGGKPALFPASERGSSPLRDRPGFSPPRGLRGIRRHLTLQEDPPPARSITTVSSGRHLIQDSERKKGQAPQRRLAVLGFSEKWAWVDSNYRPHAYQACALTT